MERWIGKVAVVTGASSGIGRDIARAFAEKGIIVVGLARRLELMEELANSVTGKIYPKKCDISIEEEIVDTFKWIEETLGGVDILVNNSGVLKLATLHSGDAEAWKKTLDVNVMGLCICTKEALKTMRNRGDDGHIIHINSVAGHYVPQYDHFSFGMYVASKYAVTSLTESLRVELRGLKSNIKITSVSPGAVKTEIVESARNNIDHSDFSLTDEMKEAPFLDVKDITEAVMYVISTGPGVQVHELTIQPIGQRIG